MWGPSRHSFYVDHILRSQKPQVIGVVSDHSGFKGKGLILDFIKSQNALIGVELFSTERAIIQTSFTAVKEPVKRIVC